MTEGEWLACGHPRPLLEGVRGTGSARKRRLFACACCRRVWDDLKPSFRYAVAVVEQAVEDPAGTTEWEVARWRLLPASLDRVSAQQLALFSPTQRFAHGILADDPHEAVLAAADLAADCPYRFAYQRKAPGTSALRGLLDQFLGWDHPARAARARAARGAERQAQAALVRDIFNPFHPVALAPAWGAWHDRTVPRLARRVYEDQVFGSLPVLADALEEAGCDHPALLAHLRDPAPHVRGCWAVDLLLGNE